MKHLWFGALLLGCLLASGAVSSYGVQQTQSRIVSQLEQAAEAGFSENWEQAEKFLTAAQGQWEKCRHFLAAFLDHDPMDEIDSLFGELKIYQKAKDSTLFAGLCQRLNQLAQAIRDSHKLNWWNLL